MYALIEAKQPEQNVKQYCKANNIREASYYYWLKKYKQLKESSSQFFIPLQVSSTGNAALASIQLPGGAVINVYHPEVFPYIHSLL